MTTGASGSSSIPAYSNGLTGSWGYREWSGDNGKYTAGVGSPTKWNNYTCYQESMMIACCQTRFLCTLPGGGGDPTTGYTPTVYRRYPNDSIFGDQSNDINSALQRLIAKAKGHSWNMAVDLAQGKQTVSMVTGALGSLGRSFMALRHGDLSTAARQLGVTPPGASWKTLDSRDVSGRWLELQYGWLPLLGSVYEACKAYEARSNGPRVARFSAGYSKSAVFDYSASPTITSFKQKFSTKRTYVLEQSEDMAAARQLGLLDPYSVAWEIIPYSFVVDWFIPIGTYLSNLNQLASLKGRWLVSTRVGPEGKIAFEWLGGKATYPYCGYHGAQHRYQVMTHQPSFIRRAGYYSRGAPSGPPSLPKPSIQSLPEAMSPKRIWNAISLAHQRFIR